MQAEALRPELLFTSLYGELVRVARREVYRCGAQAMLNPNEVVHETWLDMQGRERLCFEQPGQFLGYATRTMRGVLVDHVRASNARKRGGGLAIASLDDEDATMSAADVARADTQPLADALEELEKLDPELAQLVDLRFFCGLTIPEVAALKGISVRTAQRKWERARAVLQASVFD